MTPLALTISIGAATFVLGALLGYALGRPRRIRRRSSVELGNGAIRRGPGKHRDREG